MARLKYWGHEIFLRTWRGGGHTQYLIINRGAQKLPVSVLWHNCVTGGHKICSCIQEGAMIILSI